MLPVFTKGLLLGLGAAMPIGPVNVEIARRTLRGGFRAGFALGCGAVTVDVIYAILSSLSLARSSAYPAFYRPLELSGAVILAYLGVLCWIGAFRAGRLEINPSSEMPAPTRGYVTGLLMTFTNPMTLLFWFTSVPTAAVSAGEPLQADLPIMCVGVFVATISWVTFFASTLKWLRRWRRPWWIGVADVLGGSMLLGFAARAFWTSLAG